MKLQYSLSTPVFIAASVERNFSPKNTINPYIHEPACVYNTVHIDSEVYHDCSYFYE